MKLCKKDTFKNILQLSELYRLINKCFLLYLSDKSSDVPLWLGQILVSSRLENAEIRAKLRCYRNFFIMVRVHKNQNNHK